MDTTTQTHTEKKAQTTFSISPRGRWTTGALILAAAGMASCDMQRTETEVEDQVPTLDNITDEPQNFYGETVTVSGEVDEVFDDYSFELEDELDILFEDELLVLTTKPVKFGNAKLRDDDDVLVTGKIVQFLQKELGPDLGWDLSARSDLAMWEGKPILIANSVRRISEEGRWSADKEPEGTNVGVATILIHSEPATLVGEPLSLESVQVQEKTGRGLWIGAPLSPILAVVESEQKQIEARDWVDLSGSIGRMPSSKEAKEKWGVEHSPALDNANFYIDVARIEKIEAPVKQMEEKVSYDDFTGAMQKNMNRLVAGKAKVTKVISDRGFYLKNENGDDVFAVVREDIPEREMIDIDPDDEIEFEAWARSNEDQVVGELESDAKEAVKKSPVFLTMYWRNVSINEGT